MIDMFEREFRKLYEFVLYQDIIIIYFIMVQLRYR